MENRKVYYEVLEYPVVQYITLRQENVFLQEIPVKYGTKPLLQLIQSEHDYNNFIKHYQINDSHTMIDWQSYFLLIALNHKIEDTKYRTNRVYTFGIQKKGIIQASLFAKDLIYRNAIYFLCYDWQANKIPVPHQIYNLNST